MPRPERWRPTFLLVLGGLVIPNLLSAIAGIWFGVPPRTAAIALYALIALVSARLRGGILIAAVLAAMAFDVALAICRAFFLDPTELPDLAEMLSEVELFSSTFYIALCCGLALQIVATGVFLLRHRIRMEQGHRAIFGLACLAALGGDIALNGSVAYELGPVASVGLPFESGAQNSGFGAMAGRSGDRPNVLLVVVESLGVLRDPAARALLLAPFDDIALRQRFHVTAGTSSFFGATAYGEMRELCGSRSSYKALDADAWRHCLPEVYAARGYRTVAIHGFKKSFYDRDLWYPKAGFQRALFRDGLAPEGPYRCGGPFAGPCDADLAARVGETLKESGQPTFAYWLTLTSHIPVQPGTARPRYGCSGEAVFKDAKVCAMAEIWTDLFEGVAALAQAQPDTEILLVGDHAPPFWRRSARAQFLPDRVLWVRLSPRRSTESPRDRALTAEAAIGST